VRSPVLNLSVSNSCTPADRNPTQRICNESQTYLGGYTMLVMFKRGREQWGDLPAELKNEEPKYGNSLLDVGPNLFLWLGPVDR